MSPKDVLGFWFGDVRADAADDEHRARWWKKDPEFDAEIRTRFGALHHAICHGAHRDWLREPSGVVAYVLVLDQFSRNLGRDSAGMFCADALALHVVLNAIDSGMDRAVPIDQRLFLYMPLMHAEDRAVQDRCVSIFERFANELPEPHASRIRENVGYAERHRAIVDRFGRFPHRNALLGRPTTAEEETFLKEPGSSF
ncbi:MAG: DUF924 family protein [Myxococcota bacterium]